VSALLFIPAIIIVGVGVWNLALLTTGRGGISWKVGP